jgi:hypothetical protein
MIRRALLAGIVCCAATASAQTFLLEDFDDQAHDLQTAGGSGHTIGGGVSSQSYGVEPDGGGFDLEMRLDLVSLASDEAGGGSYVWPGARALVPPLAEASFVVEAELTIDAAFAEGSNRSLSVGLVARCSYFFNADSCPGFDANAVMKYYRLSYALVGEGAFTDAGAALASGDLRLVEHGGDGQVDATVPGLAVATGVPFTMRLEGRVVGGSLALTGRMSDGVAEAVVDATDPTPLAGPGFGVRTGGFVRGFGGGNASGALDVDVDDLLVAPEPGAAASAALSTTTLWLRGRSLRAHRRRERGRAV